MANPTSNGYVVEGYVQLGYTVYTTTGGAGIASNNVARLNDSTFGVCRVHGNQSGKIISCSSNVMANGIGIARDGDTVKAECGHIGIISSSATATRINGKLIARVGDVIKGIYAANIVSGSSNVLNGF